MLLLLPYPTSVALERFFYWTTTTTTTTDHGRGVGSERVMRGSANSEVQLCTRMVIGGRLSSRNTNDVPRRATQARRGATTFALLSYLSGFRAVGVPASAAISISRIPC